MFGGGAVGDQSQSQQQQQQGGKRAKRKLVIALGYVGTRYHGLQKAPTRRVRGEAVAAAAAVAAVAAPPQEQPLTVEHAVERALNACGCVSDANLGDLDRLGWSRMARTDKGVHAARTVVSLIRIVVPTSLFIASSRAARFTASP